jgi:hypothetical protein
MFGTLQDRLIKELAKAGIGDIARAAAMRGSGLHCASGP